MTNKQHQHDETIAFMMSVSEALLAELFPELDVSANSDTPREFEPVTFPEVLGNVFEGAMVARKAWVDSATKDVIYVKVKKDGKPQLQMRYNDGSTGKWLPKQKEIFAADWYVVHESLVQ